MTQIALSHLICVNPTAQPQLSFIPGLLYSPLKHLALFRLSSAALHLSEVYLYVLISLLIFFYITVIWTFTPWYCFLTPLLAHGKATDFCRPVFIQHLMAFTVSSTVSPL